MQPGNGATVCGLLIPVHPGDQHKCILQPRNVGAAAWVRLSECGVLGSRDTVLAGAPSLGNRECRVRWDSGWGCLVLLLLIPFATGDWSDVGGWRPLSYVMLCEAAQAEAAWEELQEQVIGVVTRLEGGGLTYGRTDGSHP
ncbi:hypothetical protein NDU88_004871 [Pleurodeles waltl]|uniref:Uncharacterized protein n=1 Tax=Pleurodeles waltl TaxID=8319 RepID=A0AAV7NNW7_PLEWA|nr:hypothetical protein NDU88_004871 [Pleurodeles waltl]